jgi:hypothetical protein
MNAHKLAVVLSEDGRLTLDGLPFRAGEVVEVIVLADAALKPELSDTAVSSLQGSDSSEKMLLEPVSQEYLASISSMMEEWESEADETAYQDL